MKSSKDKYPESQQQFGSESDFGEGEVEDTGQVKTGGAGFTYFSSGPQGSSTEKKGSRIGSKHESRSGMKHGSSMKLPPF